MGGKTLGRPRASERLTCPPCSRPWRHSSPRAPSCPCSRAAAAEVAGSAAAEAGGVAGVRRRPARTPQLQRSKFSCVGSNVCARTGRGQRRASHFAAPASGRRSPSSRSWPCVRPRGRGQSRADCHATFPSATDGQKWARVPARGRAPRPQGADGRRSRRRPRTVRRVGAARGVWRALSGQKARVNGAPRARRRGQPLRRICIPRACGVWCISHAIERASSRARAPHGRKIPGSLQRREGPSRLSRADRLERGTPRYRA